jgi:transposase
MTDKLGKRYTKEMKEEILNRMMPPNNESIKRISEEVGITETTLYKWRKEARIAGNATPGDGQGSEQWSSEDKFLIVMETYTMNEADLAEYCREKGLYKEQVVAWRGSCLHANGSESSVSKQLNQELKEEKKRGKTLEKDLQKKEKALAEAAALLLLRKKARAPLHTWLVKFPRMFLP